MKQSRNKPNGTTMGISFDRMLPQCKEAENAVIGALLIESTAIHEVYELLSKDCFYDQAAGEIYDVIRSIWENGGKPDLICVAEELKKRGTLEMVGGPFGLAVLSGHVASSSHIREHASYIHQCHLQRQLVTIGQTITQQAIDTGNDVNDTISESLTMLENLASNMVYGGGPKPIGEAARQALQDYEERAEARKRGRNVGITTGFKVLDKHLNGFRKKQLIIIGARPAMGKTALALHMAKHAAMSGVPVVFFALEMEAARMADRLIIDMANVKSAPYRGGWLTETEKAAMFNGVGLVEQLPIYVDDTSNLNIKQIKARCINLQRKGQCGMVFIDYLGLLNTESTNRSYNREQEVMQASRQAKILAKELDIPVVLLCQLNRGVESRINQKGCEEIVPGLADLRESGAIEQDADVVLMLHRPEYYNSAVGKGVGIINIAKQREGITGKVKFGYNESLTRLYDLEDVQASEEAPF